MELSFLKSLEGMAIADAMKTVQDKGYKVRVYPECAILPAIAERDLVLLFYKDDNIKFVSKADAGDPLQVTDNEIVADNQLVS